MSYHTYRPYAPDSPTDGTVGANTARRYSPSNNANAPGGDSPFSASDANYIPDEPSPWSASSQSGSGYDSLTLPPINPDNNYDELPSFDDSQYFDALPRLASPDPFLPEHSNSTPHSNSHSQSQRSRSSQNEQTARPSNQPARRHLPPISQYRVAGSESPDPFEDFIDLSPPPGDIPPRSNITTRQSSVVDLTESSPAQSNMVPSRKRKATTSGVGRANKAARPGSSRSSRSTPATAKKEDLEEIAVVDLVDVNDDKDYEALRAKEQAELIKQQNQAEATKPVKLAEFQCIICMDNPTDLTVTHCGHLFCSECLHQALYAGDKKCCPVCRTQIGAARNGTKQPKNGVFALEMKFMTANKKGKQAVRPR